jgi:hypothetical protein
MERIKAAVLLFEAVVCLLLLILLLPVAGMFGPFIGAGSWIISTLVSAWVPLGSLFGTYGLYRIIKWVLLPSSQPPGRLFLWSSLVAGLCSLMPTFVHLFHEYPDARTDIWLVGLFSAYFIYLGRDLLFRGAANKTMEPTR